MLIILEELGTQLIGRLFLTEAQKVSRDILQTEQTQPLLELHLAQMGRNLHHMTWLTLVKIPMPCQMTHFFDLRPN